jgi:septal ring factor EnvC (AmiA/AmiB activator)
MQAARLRRILEGLELAGALDLNMATRRSEDESGPMPENGAAADGATAEQPCQSSPRVKASRFRAAYEALIEPLVNATVKVAEAETEHQILRAQFGSLQAEIAALQAQVATLQAEIGTLQARLASSQTERAQLVEQLQAVYQSHSWRVTEPLRRAITLIRRLRRP